MTSMSRPLSVRVVGHPFAPSGMGEHCRSTVLALVAAGASVDLVDVFGHWPPDEVFLRQMEDLRLPGAAQRGKRVDCEIFTVNFDELPRVMEAGGARLGGARARVLYPAWELPHLPEQWVKEAVAFDALWASSDYTASSFRESGVHVSTVGLSVRRIPAHFATRRTLGIPEGEHLVLTSLHLASYWQRKNPVACAAAVNLARQELPPRTLGLVVKISGAAENPAAAEAITAMLQETDPSVTVIAKNMAVAEYAGLLRSVDSVISLHRAEGFGFAIAEAMRLGRPVVCTGYSGNMDYSNKVNACLVDFDLVGVQPGEYPYPHGQFWADPSVDQAAEHLLRILKEAGVAESLALEGRRTASTVLSHSATGGRMMKALEEMASLA